MFGVHFCCSVVGQETASFIQSLCSSSQFGHYSVPAFFLFQPSSGFSPSVCICKRRWGLRSARRSFYSPLASHAVEAQPPRWHKQNGSSWLELFPSFILKMQISMAVKEEMGSELLPRLWGGRWTGDCVVPFEQIALGKLPLRSFLHADEGKSRFDLSYKLFPMCLSLRCLASMFYSCVLWLSSISGVPADRLCKALQCSSPWLAAKPVGCFMPSSFLSHLINCQALQGPLAVMMLPALLVSAFSQQSNLLRIEIFNLKVLQPVYGNVGEI